MVRKDAIMNLPIDVIHGSNPPRFKWRQTIDTPAGSRTIDHDGCLPPTVENAVVLLLDLTKQVMRENAMLQGTVKAMSERVAAQSDILSRKAEKPEPAPAKKGK